MQLDEAIEKRYSVRKFSGKPVPADALGAVLEAVRVAPSARNQQPVRVLVCSTPEELAKIDACTPCRYGAPAVLVFACDDERRWKKENRADCGPVDVSIAATYAMLKATDLGLGTVWVMNFEAAKLSEAFGLPANLRPICLLPLGEAAPDAEPGPNHALRVPLSEILLKTEDR